MSRRGIVAADAFAQLRKLSQSRGVKLSAVAHDIVAEAMSRARAGHAEEKQPLAVHKPPR